jgi:hypothetical protein
MDPIRIVIEQNTVEYIPDYPEGWKFSAGDPFKFPVPISGYQCFIKRFENKQPENIPGWDLLTQLKQKHQENLPRVHAIKEVIEKDKPVFYLFYECLTGKTLEETIAEGKRLQLEQMTEDLFSALQNVHRLGFWVPDFCEKNIFCTTDGSFLLVDLDSCHSLSEFPANDMQGSKDYWIPVYKFYKEILHGQLDKLSDIDGAGLNYLQVPFLILRLKLFFETGNDKYNSNEIYDQLPSLLNNIDPSFKEIFALLLKEGASSATILKIKKAIHQKILGSGVKEKNEAPVIKAFSVSHGTAGKGEPFTLRWEVQGADRVELHRNGIPFQTFNAGETILERAEFYDNDQPVSFELVAYQGSTRAKSTPLLVSFKRKNRVRRALIILAGLAILATIIFYLQHSPAASKITALQATGIHEGESFTFYGENLEPDSMEVTFNATPAEIVLASPDSLVIKVPDTIIDDLGWVRLRVIQKGNTIYSNMFTFISDTIRLMDYAPAAKWTAGQSEPEDLVYDLTWEGPENGFGFVKAETKQGEDNTFYTILKTHPRWVGTGMISGLFSNQSGSGFSLQKKRRYFESFIGFQLEGKSLDGVNFKVLLHFIQNGLHVTLLIINQHKDYSGSMMKIEEHIPDEIPEEFKVELRVDAGPSSNSDWAIWVNPILIQKRLEIASAAPFGAQ